MHFKHTFLQHFYFRNVGITRRNQGNTETHIESGTRKAIGDILDIREFPLQAQVLLQNASRV
jgi:hypothetical protein